MLEMIDGVPVEELERRMQPGSWTPEGFLARGQSLVEVMAKDAHSLQHLKREPKDIARALESFLERAAGSDLFRPVRIERFRVQIFHSRKMRTCPWAEQEFERCLIGQGVEYLTTDDFEIVNTRLGKRLGGTSLCVHLIRDHHFFGGPDTPFRIDPTAAAKVLEL
jgi:hypothetical protein